jgi:hypothetical protein
LTLLIAMMITGAAFQTTAAQARKKKVTCGLVIGATAGGGKGAAIGAGVGAVGGFVAKK